MPCTVKIRLSRGVSNDGANEREGLRRAIEIAEECGLPLMVHHGASSLSVEEVLGTMRTGDLYTHCFHPATDNPDTGTSDGTAVVDSEPNGLVAAAVSARERGIQFCLGHGQGSFVWNVAEAAAREGFFADSLSTDLHVASINGPVYDMPTMITKHLMLGMGLGAAIAASTIQPAQMIGWGDRIGTLGVGRGADIAVFSLESVDVMLEDTVGQLRPCKQRLLTRAVWRDGVRCRVTEEEVWPNPESQAWQGQRWALISPKTRDPEPPPPPDPAVAARVEARQEHLQFLAGAVARMGDCTPNMPIYLSPTAIGHLNKWAVLPWCSEPVGDDAGDAAERPGACGLKVALCGRGGGGREANGAAGGEGQAVAGGEEEAAAQQATSVIQRRRPLVSFANSAQEQEALRLAVMTGCC